MLRFFRSSRSSVIVVILLTGLATWAHTLSGIAVPSPAAEHGSMLFQSIANRLNAVPGLQTWCGLLLMLTTAVLLVYVNASLRLIDQISYLPALCYVLLTGGVPELHRFNPMLMVAPLLAAGFIVLVKSFAGERLSYGYFAAAMFVSAAALIYPGVYIHITVVWMAIALWRRPGHWREWVFTVLGFGLPLFLAFSWFFLLDDDFTRMSAFFGALVDIRRGSASLGVPTAVFMLLCGAAAVLTFGHVRRYVGSRKIIVRNGYYILILAAGATVGMACVTLDAIPSAWYLLAFPLSFFLSNYMAATASARRATIVLWSLFAAVVMAQAIAFFAE